jgi:hypothetical protein
VIGEGLGYRLCGYMGMCCMGALCLLGV